MNIYGKIDGFMHEICNFWRIRSPGEANNREVLNEQGNIDNKR